MSEKHERILIVDDEEKARKVIRVKLSREGYHCQEVASADQALEELKKGLIDLVILDIRMPGKSGIQLLPEIIALYPGIAVIMSTAVTDTDTVLQCMKQGAYDYITKPFNADEILDLISKTVK